MNETQATIPLPLFPFVKPHVRLHTRAHQVWELKAVGLSTAFLCNSPSLEKAGSGSRIASPHAGPRLAQQHREPRGALGISAATAYRSLPENSRTELFLDAAGHCGGPYLDRDTTPGWPKLRWDTREALCVRNKGLLLLSAVVAVMMMVQSALTAGRHRGGTGRADTAPIVMCSHSPLSIAPSQRRTRSGCRLAPLRRSSRLQARDAVLTSSVSPPAPPTWPQLQNWPCISGEVRRRRWRS